MELLFAAGRKGEKDQCVCLRVLVICVCVYVSRGHILLVILGWWILGILVVGGL